MKCTNGIGRVGQAAKLSPGLITSLESFGLPCKLDSRSYITVIEIGFYRIRSCKSKSLS